MSAWPELTADRDRPTIVALHYFAQVIGKVPSHEESSAGFWPGGAGAEGGPFFYSYAYPSPDGFASAKVRPEAARWDAALGEFVLDYAAVQGAPDPDTALLRFLTSTYEAAAELAKWDRVALECATGRPGVPRQV